MRTLLLSLLVVVLAVCAVFTPVEAEVGTRYTRADLVRAIGNVAPHVSMEQRGVWAQRILEADERFGVGDPMLLLAVVRKESNFNSKVMGNWDDEGATTRRIRKRGPGGEYGAMQIHPDSGWRAFPVAGCHDPERPGLYALTPECAFYIGVKMFSHMKQTCPGSYNVAIASYKWGHCRTERFSRGEVAAKNARVYFCEGLGDYSLCDNRWLE